MLWVWGGRDQVKGDTGGRGWKATDDDYASIQSNPIQSKADDLALILLT
jgi:hypothetical protein